MGCPDVSIHSEDRFGNRETASNHVPLFEYIDVEWLPPGFERRIRWAVGEPTRTERLGGGVSQDEIDSSFDHIKHGGSTPRGAGPANSPSIKAGTARTARRFGVKSG